MVERLIEFLSECPVLEGRAINCGYLGDDAGSCSVEMGARVYEAKRYSDGARLMKRQFVLALREIYSQDVQTNLTAAGVCTEVERWIEEMNRAGKLPNLSGFGTAKAISVAQGFRLMSTESLDARYEAELELEWYEE